MKKQHPKNELRGTKLPYCENQFASFERNMMGVRSDKRTSPAAAPTRSLSSLAGPNTQVAGSKLEVAGSKLQLAGSKLQVAGSKRYIKVWFLGPETSTYLSNIHQRHLFFVLETPAKSSNTPHFLGPEVDKVVQQEGVVSEIRYMSTVVQSPSKVLGG